MHESNEAVYKVKSIVVTHKNKKYKFVLSDLITVSPYPSWGNGLPVELVEYKLETTRKTAVIPAFSVPKFWAVIGWEDKIKAVAKTYIETCYFDFEEVE